MSDLVKRLRILPLRDLDNPALREEAAGEIERLRHQLEKARGEPVAWQWRYVGDREWKTASGGVRVSSVNRFDHEIEHRPLYALTDEKSQ